MPPVPENVAVVHLNFALAPEEIAVCTFSMRLRHGAGNPLDWPQTTQKAAEIVRDKWLARMQEAASYFAPNVSLSHVDTYHLAADTGLTLDKGTAAMGPGQHWAGGGQPALPLEVALAVSLYGYTPGVFVPNRARMRGRMYLPPLNVSAMAGTNDGNRQGRVSNAVHADLSAKLSDFFNDIQGMQADGSQNPLGGQDVWELGVLSRKFSEFYKVNTIRLGDVWDSQRRRRNAQEEFYRDMPIGPN